MEIQEKWDKKSKLDLTLRAVKNYLDNRANKGCIFFSDHCTIYNKRPLICRLYGIIPQSSWDHRWKALKERHGDKFEAKNQCDLVSLKSGKSITEDDENKWFAYTRTAEERIGVTQETIKKHDLGGGSYRTFHDHLLIELFDDRFLNMLTKARLSNPSESDVADVLNSVKDSMNSDETI